MLPKTTNMKIGFLNPGSLGSRQDEFIAAMLKHNADLVGINETWLREGEEGRAPVVPGYRLRHIPRPRDVRTRGGGVGFYLRRGLRACVCAHPPAPPVEQMWLSTSVAGARLIIGTAYRPPWLNTDIFIDAMTNTICTLSAQCDNIILIGDFNIDILSNSNDCKKLISFLSYLDLRQFVNSATHFTDHSSTLIDLFCGNTEITNITTDYIPCLSGHAFITGDLKFKKNKVPRRFFDFRPLKSINIHDFESDLSTVDWEGIGHYADINVMVTAFNAAVIALFDRHAPVKRVMAHEQCHPWITGTVREMMRLRDDAHDRYRLSCLDAHKSYYKELKSIVNIALFHEKQAFFKENINKQRDSKVLWKNIKRTVDVSRRCNDSDLPSHLRDANAINSHFLTVPGEACALDSDLEYYESHRFGDSGFDLEPVSQDMVLKCLNTIKSTAVGNDGITLDMLILTLPGSLYTITNIVNKSILSGTYPDVWKMALVTPLPKNSNVVQYKDLRPISILPCISKVLEKIVRTQLSSFIEENKLLPALQSGFRRNHSTTTALIDITDNILSAQDAGEVVLLVLLDFSRAFDALNVPLLLSKLSFYGFSTNTTKWFASYFKNRVQRVKISDSDGSVKISNMAPVERGVPQGSILGPILFSLYSADVCDVIKHCKYHIYADDIQLYITCRPHDISSSIAKVNEDLSSILSWADRNTLVLNPSKSKYLVLGTRNQILKVPSDLPEIKIKNMEVERVFEARNLGVLMDVGLRFEGHVMEIVRGCFYRLKLLYRIRDYLNEDLRVKLCDSLVLSKLGYADIVYGPRLLARTQRLVQRVQNACARYCFRVPPRTHVTPFLNNAGILKMTLRQELHLATLMFGLVKTETPEYLYKKLEWRRGGVSGSRAVSCPLRIPRFQTTVFRGGFKYAASKCWNNLPPPIRELNSLVAFKKSLKNYLLDFQKELPVGGRVIPTYLQE